MPLESVAIIALMVAGFGAMLLLGSRMHSGSLKSARKRTCAETAGESSGALVKVTGHAATAEPLVAPLSGEPCVYYALEISQYRYTGPTRNSRRRERITESTDWAFWQLEDGTGTVEVQPDDCDVHTAVTRSEYVSMISGEHPLLREYRIEPGFQSPVIIEESIIPVGAEVFACGRVLHRRDGPVLAGGRDLTISAQAESSLHAHNLALAVLGGLVTAGGVVVLCVAVYGMLAGPPPPEPRPSASQVQAFRGR